MRHCGPPQVVLVCETAPASVVLYETDNACAAAKGAAAAAGSEVNKLALLGLGSHILCCLWGWVIFLPAS